MRIALGCDHAAIELKNAIFFHLTQKGYQVELFVPDGGDKMDYPYYAEKAASAVKYGLCDLGVLICGTGAGMSIAANKVNGVRAVNCADNYTARYAKEHNNANMLCIGSRVLAKEAAFMLVDTWLDAQFDGGRHEKRVEMFEQIEQRQKA